MEKTKSFGVNHNLAYDDYELFGLPESSKTVDTSKFEELFGKDENGLRTGFKAQQNTKATVKKVEKNPVRKRRHLLNVLSGLMTVSFVLMLFSIIIS